MNELVVGSVAGLIVFVVSAAVTYFVRKYWFIRPEIQLRNVSDTSSSSAIGPTTLELTWNHSLELYNSSKHDALNLNFVTTSYTTPLPLPALEQRHLSGLETMQLPYHLKRTHDRQEVATVADRFGEFLPEELRETVLILKYTNEMGNTTYTRYERDGNEERCSFHRRLPSAT